MVAGTTDHTHWARRASALLAPLVQTGLANTEARERSIFSAAADAVEAYTSHAALAPPPTPTSTRSGSSGPATPFTSTRRPRARRSRHPWRARARRGPLADGFLTLFGAKPLLPGIGDRETLDAVSVALGEYDRQILATTRGPGRAFVAPQVTRTTSVQRQPVLSPGEIANIPRGHALYLQGVSWELARVTPAHREQPWPTPTAAPAAEAVAAPTGSAR